MSHAALHCDGFFDVIHRPYKVLHVKVFEYFEIQSCGLVQFVVVHKLHKWVSLLLQTYASDTPKLLVLQILLFVQRKRRYRQSWARTPTSINMPSTSAILRTGFSRHLRWMPIRLPNKSGPGRSLLFGQTPIDFAAALEILLTFPGLLGFSNP